jgi:endonuclease/exonuclease/phosphatase family metal-dependent hydrolase
MKRLLVILLPISLVLGSGCRSPIASGPGTPGAAVDRVELPAPAPTAPAVIRVLTYNIRHGEGRDRVIDLARTAEVMKSTQPDIIALQEVDRWTDRSGGVDQLAELARLMGMHAEFGKAIAYGGGDYGVAVLSRWPILSAENRHLPSSEYYEQRTALSVQVRVGEQGPVVMITSAHLSTSREVGDALGQSVRINELLATGDGVPSILAGDFNAGPGTDIMGVLEAEWTMSIPDPLPQTQPSATTAAAAGPSSPPSGGATSPSSQTVPASPPGPGGSGRGRGGGPRNDYVLYRPASQWRVIESRLIDDLGASDHRPVLTILEWVGTP